MNYRHGYHAGNFADVLKHTALCELLRLLTVKDKKLFVLDTHAGAGGYDLGGALAQRTREAE
ncbi:MAG: 23S rRNA (adenine(2030)-N(6))-methyltransferase RlmJ, partial [Reyranellales bacterium]